MHVKLPSIGPDSHLIGVFWDISGTHILELGIVNARTVRVRSVTDRTIRNILIQRARNLA